MSTYCFNEEKYTIRQNKFLDQIDSSNAGSILVFGYGSVLGAGTKSHGAIRYLTGWDSHEACSLFVLSKDTRVLLVSSPFMVPVAKQQYSNITIIYVPPTQWLSTLNTELKTTLSVGLIGFDEMPAAIYKSLIPLVENDGCVYLDEQLSLMRLIKDEDEIALHKKGAAICDELFASLKNEYSQDTAVWKTQLALETQAKRQGADYCKTWLTIRPVADYPRYWPEEGHRIPQRGDQVLFGIALSVEGHWAHGIRMGAIGPVNDSHQRLWALVMQMMTAGSHCLQPGNAMSQCEVAINEVFSQYQKDRPAATIHRFRNGHGLGTSYEDPLITDYFPQHFKSQPSAQDNTAQLTVQPSMLLELHPNIFLPDIGAAAIGEMILVTKDGPQNLLTFPTQLFEL